MAGKPFSRQEPCPGSGQHAGEVPLGRARRATCGECGRPIQRHQDGTLYDHVRVYTINYPPMQRYDGSERVTVALTDEDGTDYGAGFTRRHIDGSPDA